MKLGRPRRVPDRVAKRIKRERSAGKSYQAIADRLNADGVPTGHGASEWTWGTVRKVALR